MWRWRWLITAMNLRRLAARATPESIKLTEARSGHSVERHAPPLCERGRQRRPTSVRWDRAGAGRAEPADPRHSMV
jgi:hypothetical protein